MIPKKIWHTYETEYNLLPKNIKQFRESWIKEYPDFEHNYMSAEDRNNFILKEYGEEWYKVFNLMPHNIMKANLWRYMILYIYGGVYFDLDTCPVYNINEIIKDYDFVVVADESEELLFFIQFIAASPKSPILKNILDYIYTLSKTENFKKDKLDKYFVFRYSGELVFFNGIKQMIDPYNEISHIATHSQYNDMPNAKQYNFISYGKEYDIFKGNAFKNLDGAKNWKIGYNDWWKELDNMERDINLNE